MTLGFAIIDCWSGSPNAAIWHVSRVTQSEADKTNAVLLRKDSDNDFDKKVEALTHSRILLCTEGSDIAELALASEVTNVRFLFNFIKIAEDLQERIDRKSTRLNSSHVAISYAVFCLKNKYFIL